MGRPRQLMQAGARMVVLALLNRSEFLLYNSGLPNRGGTRIAAVMRSSLASSSAQLVHAACLACLACLPSALPCCLVLNFICSILSCAIRAFLLIQSRPITIASISVPTAARRMGTYIPVTRFLWHGDLNYSCGLPKSSR